MSDVVRITAKLWESTAGYWHWCPGCKTHHPLPKSWIFDGNLQSPTFNPSFLQHPSLPQHKRCHYFLHAGTLKFCSDSQHELAGKEVPLPDIPDGATIFSDM
jgi:hypothetical protein